MKSHFQSKEIGLHFEWRRLRCQRLRGIKIMGCDPGNATEEHDHENRDAPDYKLDSAGIDPIRQIACPGVRASKPPGKDKRCGDRRDHDREHDGERVDEDHLLGYPNRSLWVEDRRLTCGQDHRRHKDRGALSLRAHRTKAPEKVHSSGLPFRLPVQWHAAKSSVAAVAFGMAFSQFFLPRSTRF